MTHVVRSVKIITDLPRAGSFVLAIPGPLADDLIDQAEAEGLTLEQLVVTLLSVPLGAIAHVRVLKCPTCGVPWIRHEPGCARHGWRPDWARALEGREGRG